MNTILKNLEVLLEVIKRTPEDRYDLGFFTQQRACGAVHCTYGWAARVPFFRAQGLRDDHTWPLLGGVEIGSSNTRLNELFGPAAFFNLFSGDMTYDPAHIDSEWVTQNSPVMDEDGDLPTHYHKQLAIFRIERQIELVKGAQNAS